MDATNCRICSGPGFACRRLRPRIRTIIVFLCNRHALSEGFCGDCGLVKTGPHFFLCEACANEAIARQMLKMERWREGVMA